MSVVGTVSGGAGGGVAAAAPAHPSATTQAATNTAQRSIGPLSTSAAYDRFLNAPPMPAAVLVVDFGAQYAQLIARRVRELHVYSEIVPNRLTAAEVAARDPAALILSGGPKSVHVPGAPQLDPAVYELGVPILGICYGAQLIAQQLGGTVGRGPAR